jgi:16S rRNA (cytidine1402-2'-O)-methyltransferase
MAGTLFLVATPIGNLQDFTYRAARVLAEVDLIACEDTRHAAKLLSHYKISTPTVSYHEHNEQRRSPQLLARLQAGHNIALISDAGTPLVSDPGYRLVRAALLNTITVVSVPGPSALLAALASSGFPVEPFHFAGFLSAKRTQFRSQLSEMLALHGTTLVLFEAPHRLLAALADIAEVFGPDHPVAVARELTKLHEEVLRGPVLTIQTQLAARASIKGEITIVVGPREAPPSARPDDASLRAEVDALIREGASRMDAIKEVARRHRLPKRDVYRIIG